MFTRETPKQWLDWKRCELWDFEEREKTLKRKGVDACQVPTRELTRGYVFGDYVAGACARVVLAESGGMG